MSSKSGGHDARIQGRQGPEVLKGRALSASHTKPKKLADREHEAAGCSKDGGCAEKFRENNDGFFTEQREISFKPTSNGGRGGLKVLQTEKVAEKLALLSNTCQKLSEKFANQKFQNRLEKENFCETSSKTTSIGGQGEDKNNREDGAGRGCSDRGADFERESRKGLPIKDTAWNESDTRLSSAVDSTSGSSENSQKGVKDVYQKVSFSNVERQPIRRGESGGVGDSHYIVKAGQVDLVNNDNGVDHEENSLKEAKSGHTGSFSKESRREVGRGRFGGDELRGENEYSTNYAQKVDNLCRINPKHQVKGHDQSLSPVVGLKFDLVNRSGGEDRDEIRGEIRGKNGNIFRETDEEKFWENNVEIFRNAFGDNHYLANAGRAGFFSKDNHQVRDFALENPDKRLSPSVDTIFKLALSLPEERSF